MGAMKPITKFVKGRMVNKGAKLAKKNPAPQLPKGVFDKIAEPKSEFFTAGFSKTDIMPADITKKKYWIAGYNAYNPAKGVLDPMTTSAVWLDDNSGRGGVVFISVDSVGLTNYDVKLARDGLKSFCEKTGCRSINLFSTHDHAAIDTVGMWGPIPLTGRDKGYMKILHDGIKKVVEEAYANKKEGSLYYGKKETPEIQRDSRLPTVFNKNLTRLRFVPNDGGTEIWILNYASHTESMLGHNPIVSADFACYMRRGILEQTGAEVLYGVGAIGGLIRLKELDKDNIVSTKMGGKALADTAVAIEDERKLSPVINFLRQEYYSPVDNYVLATLASIGVLKSEFCPGDSSLNLAVKTEMTYFEIGDLKMLLLPSEIFPELVYGGYLSAEESAEGKGPEINPEPLVKIAGDDNLLLFGVTNDFTGYVVPPNDFLTNKDIPYADRAKDRLGRGHYEETNSLGPKTAQTIADTFKGVMETVNGAR
jgi:hypothetical protein